MEQGFAESPQHATWARLLVLEGSFWSLLALRCWSENEADRLMSEPTSAGALFFITFRMRSCAPPQRAAPSLSLRDVGLNVQQGRNILEWLQVVKAHFTVAPEKWRHVRGNAAQRRAADAYIGQLLSCLSAMAHAFCLAGKRQWGHNLWMR